ncbi:transposase [Chlorobium limicola]
MNCVSFLLRQLDKALIHDIYRAETEQDARDAYRRFQERYAAKYPSAVASLLKDEASMFSFYKYPAEHWRHPCRENSGRGVSHFCQKNRKSCLIVRLFE